MVFRNGILDAKLMGDSVLSNPFHSRRQHGKIFGKEPMEFFGYHNRGGKKDCEKVVDGLTHTE